MDLEGAKRNITYAWVLSFIGIIVALGFSLNPYLAELTKPYYLYLFVPWLFPSGLVMFYAAIVSGLTFLLYRKSRVGAILLFILFVFERAFTFIWLYVFPTTFIITWICVNLIWTFIFFQGTRGTFIYHNITDKTKAEAE